MLSNFGQGQWLSCFLQHFKDLFIDFSQTITSRTAESSETVEVANQFFCRKTTKIRFPENWVTL